MTETQSRATAARPALSVVVPVHNEADNIEPLAREIHSALTRVALTFEIIFVDDASTDATAAKVRLVRQEQIPGIRLLRHAKRRGQSAALHTGVVAARAIWVATLDGDGQNDPADIPGLFAVATAENNGAAVRLFMGHRVSRHDSWVRRVSSRIANGVRGSLLRDETPDTGCGIKVLHRDTFLQLPTFDHMHRFLPALFLRAGARVISLPVRHRLRTRGQSKYGIANRLWVGIVDLFGVRWLIKRALIATEIREE